MAEVITDNERFAGVNVDFPGCIDGRKAIFVLEQKKDGDYTVVFNEEQLKDKNYPQVLGAALGFVAVAEATLGLSMTQAFDLVDIAFQKANFRPSFHVDDEHGHLKAKYENLYATGNDKKLVKEILKRIKGCGFAVYQWSDKATVYIQEAIKRGWVIQVLTGNHDESKGGAYLNYESNTSLDVAAANDAGEPAFNMDMLFVALILKEMQRQAGKDGVNVKTFTTDSLQWFTQTYASVVVALGGVEDISQIKIHD